MFQPSQQAAPETAATDPTPTTSATELGRQGRGTAAHGARRTHTGAIRAAPPRAPHHSLRPALSSVRCAADTEGRLTLPLWKVGVSILP